MAAPLSPAEIRYLVLDYLVTHAHLDAALSFARAAGLAFDSHRADALRTRIHIRTHVLAGHIPQALALIAAHFPFIVSSTPLSRPSSSLSLRQPNPPSPAARPESYVRFSNTSARPDPSIESEHAPTLLYLAIQTQAFIELVRAAIPPSTTDSDHPSPISTSSTASSLSNASLSAALTHAQSLHALAATLPPPLIANNLKELESVCGILAYLQPEDSPVKHYFDLERRQSLALRIDQAILSNMGQSPISALERIVRQTTLEWDSILQFKIPLPSSSSDKNPQQPRPFDLATFLKEDS